MTSLIFGSIYLGHQGWVKHRHEKQRLKNYERWEGLRDEYDDQKRTQRESRSLDIQRTGQYQNGFDNGYGYGVDDKPILTLRDQQEANDARTGWRPQESWETGEERRIREDRTGYTPVRADGRRSMDASSLHAPRPVDHRSVSEASGIDHVHLQQQQQQYLTPGHQATQLRPLSSQKTGAVWDEGLPPPLAVQRRNWDEENANASSSRLPSRSGSQRQGSSLRPSPQPPSTPFDTHSSAGNSKASSLENLPRVNEGTEVNESHIPGGFMAELIEGQKVIGQRNVSAPVQRSNNPFEQQPVYAQNGAGGGSGGQRSNNPFENVQTPAGEKDMMEWWK